MRNLRTIGKIFGVLSVAAIFTSCHKEKECECTEIASVNGVSNPSLDIATYTTKQKCWELDFTTTYTDGGDTYVYGRECEKK